MFDEQFIKKIVKKYRKIPSHTYDRDIDLKRYIRIKDNKVKVAT